MIPFWVIVLNPKIPMILLHEFGVKNGISQDDGTVFVPNAETFKNGVMDFHADIQIGDMEYSDAKNWANMKMTCFGDMDISNKIPD